tara:strand:+ start:771 stop:953 length:183 start_codon:yes stop_codon:yes gene_type:complete
MAFPTDPIYKLCNSPLTGKLDSVKKQINNITLSIPIAETNTDYQEYLAWVAEGNTAEAAD